jgi:hypothetical protein
MGGQQQLIMQVPHYTRTPCTQVDGGHARQLFYALADGFFVGQAIPKYKAAAKYSYHIGPVNSVKLRSPVA